MVISPDKIILSGEKVNLSGEIFLPPHDKLNVYRKEKMNAKLRDSALPLFAIQTLVLLAGVGGRGAFIAESVKLAEMRRVPLTFACQSVLPSLYYLFAEMRGETYQVGFAPTFYFAW